MQRLVPGRRVPLSRGQQLEAIFQPVQDLFGGQGAQPDRGQLDCQRDTVLGGGRAGPPCPGSAGRAGIRAAPRRPGPRTGPAPPAGPACPGRAGRTPGTATPEAQAPEPVRPGAPRRGAATAAGRARHARPPRPAAPGWWPARAPGKWRTAAWSLAGRRRPASARSCPARSARRRRRGSRPGLLPAHGPTFPAAPGPLQRRAAPARDHAPRPARPARCRQGRPAGARARPATPAGTCLPRRPR